MERRRRYVVRQGDYLSKLAFTMGFDADATWNHSGNDELRAKRPNPEMLHPGDILSLPEPVAAPIRVSAGASLELVATVPTAAIKLTVHGDDGRPVAGAAFTVTGAGAEIAGVSDGAGQLSFDVPVHVSEVRVVVAGLARGLRVRIGHLDPIEEVSGVRKRLQHLNYLGEHVTDEDSMAHRTDAAVRMFQRDNGIEPSGVVDDATRAALLDRHGS